MGSNLGRHISGHLPLWTAIMAVLAALAFLFRMKVGAGYHLGDLSAIALMIAGGMITLKSQRDFARDNYEAEQ